MRTVMMSMGQRAAMTVFFVSLALDITFPTIVLLGAVLVDRVILGIAAGFEKESKAA